MNLLAWSIKWQIPLAAIADLKRQMGLDGTNPMDGVRELFTEAGAQTAIRIEGAEKGILLWRNNVGAFEDETGRWVRYGLANDSRAMNKRIKSHDLVGLRPDGQFISREVKEPGWHYTGTGREKAQYKFMELVLANGGDSGFATGVGTL
jgi:hypothetical protein|tara:strand:- start:5086 stop:5532 length:447 start_codon:yes stop_codon:yes gene_type:complete